MLKFWLAQGSYGISSVNRDVKNITMNVLTHVALGISYSFSESLNTQPIGSVMNFREAWAILVTHVFVAIAIPKRILSLSFMPETFRKVSRAISEVQRYIHGALETESNCIQQSTQSTNLLSGLLRGSLEAQKSSSANMPKIQRDQGLNAKEIFSNLFIIMLAGHETTGNSLAHTIFYLAANPELQDWISEEIREVLGDREQEELDYSELFPRLKRCRAVLVSPSFLC